MHSKRERDNLVELLLSNKEQNYEAWCKIQLEEILSKTDINMFASNIEKNNKRKNGFYLCSRCGRPKKGHVCKLTNISLKNR